MMSFAFSVASFAHTSNVLSNELTERRLCLWIVSDGFALVDRVSEEKELNLTISNTQTAELPECFIDRKINQTRTKNYNW